METPIMEYKYKYKFLQIILVKSTNTHRRKYTEKRLKLMNRLVQIFEVFCHCFQFLKIINIFMKSNKCLALSLPIKVILYRGSNSVLSNICSCMYVSSIIRTYFKANILATYIACSNPFHIPS